MRKVRNPPEKAGFANEKELFIGAMYKGPLK
jgi:hypothetical protein